MHVNATCSPAIPLAPWLPVGPVVPADPGGPIGPGPPGGPYTQEHKHIMIIFLFIERIQQS